jgi:hypothetical protein
VFSTERPGLTDSRRSACGSCRSRGRTERAHRSFETTERFPQLPQGTILQSDPLIKWYRATPVPAPDVAPRPSGGVAHAMAVSVASGCRRQQLRRREAPRVCCIERARLRPRSSGRSGPVRPENVARKQVTFARAYRPVAVLENGGSCALHSMSTCDRREVITWGGPSTPSAITTTMLHLCSAPCKTLRFAPPAHARGLRALTVPARR